MEIIDLVIIGGGSAGMSAAVQAYDDGIRSILILEKEKYMGGVLDQCIHNGFGLTEFKEELTGPEYAQRFLDKVNERRIKYKTSSKVISITPSKEVTYSNKEEGIVTIQAKAIILSIGCYENGPAGISLSGTRPSGIYTAGLAQRYLNINGYLVGKKVVILGSGDIGLIMARRLTLEGAKVISVNEINPYCAGLNRNVQQCLIDFDIPLHLSTTVKQVIGKKRLEKVILAKVDDKFNFIPGTEEEVECDTLILSVGLVPYLPLLMMVRPEICRITKSAAVDEGCQTSVPGIFICGNSLHIHDVVDFVTDEARTAGHYASKLIKGNISNSSYVNTNAICPIGYVVPQRFHENPDENIKFKFRVRKPLKNCTIYVKNNENTIKKLVKPALIPSEMEIITLSPEELKDIKGTLEFSVEEAI